MLRGLGASLALPLLDGMMPALTAQAQTSAAPVHRFGVVYVPNGMVMENYLPATEGTWFELTPTLQALAPFRVADPCAERAQLHPAPGRPGGAHAKASTRYLTNISPPDERDVARRRHLARSDPGQRARQGNAAGLARTGDREQRHRRRLRRGLCLRLHQHDLVAELQHAAADAAQPARGVRAPVRRPRQYRRRAPGWRGSASSAACSTR